MIDEQELSLWIKRLEAEPSSWKNYERLSILYAIRSQLNLTASAHATPLENGFYQGRSGKMGGGVGKL